MVWQAIIPYGVIEMTKKDEQLKLEIAKELGLYDKIREHGWKSLSPKETGRIEAYCPERRDRRRQGDMMYQELAEVYDRLTRDIDYGEMG